MTHVTIMYIKSMLYTPVGVGYWPEGVLSYLGVLGMCCWSGCLFSFPALAQGVPIVISSFQNWHRVLFEVLGLAPALVCLFTDFSGHYHPSPITIF